MARRRRKMQDHGLSGVNLALIVTPMLDVAFQLLAFFVMTYHPSALEGSYKISQVLPPEKKVGFAGPKDKKDDLPGDIEPKLSDVVLVSLKATTRGQFKDRGEGEIYRVFLKKPELPAPEMIADGDQGDGNARCLEIVGLELKKLREAGNAAADLKLEPDPELKHEFVMSIMGVCRKEGFKKISFVDPAATKK